MRIAGVYSMVAAAWIFAGDVMLPPGSGDAVTGLVKGGLFVGVTTAALFWGCLRVLKKYHKAISALKVLATAADTAREALMICGPDGRIEKVNPAFKRITGYTAEEAVGRTPAFLKSGEHGPDFYADMWETLEAGRPFSAEFTNRRKDGLLYRQLQTITPIQDQRGRIVHYISISRDVTIERELEEHLDYLQQTELIGQMAGGVAHDFKNILGIILSSAEIAEAAKAAGEEAEVDEMLLQVQEASRRGVQLVQRLVSLETPADEDERLSALHLRDVVGVVEGELRSTMGKPITLDVRERGESRPILGDRMALEQIVVNLVQNARDATSGPGTITIEIDAESGQGQGRDMILLRVQDTGEGIQPEVMERLFEPYFTTKRGRGGTGLGLAMVRALMDRLHGRIEVESTLGEGATFTLSFPVAEAWQVIDGGTSEQGKPTVEAPSGGRGARVLLVEDEDALRTATQRLLQRLGYETTAAAGAAEALALLDDDPTRFDTVLSDILMPGMNGRDLYRAAQTLGCSAAFVFVSGRRPARGLEMAGHVLAKPYTVEQLDRVLQTAHRADEGSSDGVANAR